MNCITLVITLVIALAVAAAPGSKAVKTPPSEEKKASVRKQQAPAAVVEPKLVQPPAPTVAETAAPAPTPRMQFKLLDVGAIAGPTVFFSGGPLVMRIGGQVEAKLLPISDVLALELEAPLVLGFGRQTVSFAGLFEFTSSIFMVELAPSAQLVLSVAPSFGLYGGFGLGPVLASTTSAVQFEGPQTSTSFGMLIRLTSGARFKVNDQVAIFVEPMSFHIYAMGGSTVQVAGQTLQTSGSTGVAYLFSVGASYFL